MATSDNVVRAGLTPKLRDVDTLLSMLTYTSAPAHAQLQQPSQFAPNTLLYDPPIEEFSVACLDLAAGDGAVEKHRAIAGPSVIIVTEGAGVISVQGEEDVQIRRGEVLFVAADKEVEFKVVTQGEKGLTLYRAFVEA